MPFLAAPTVTRHADIPPVSAASRPGGEASGRGNGAYAGTASALAPAGGTRPGSVALPLFNPFLARRSQRRLVGLPQRADGLWAILRVLGWGRRKRGGRSVPELDLEEAATLRAWRAALARRSGM